MALSEKDATEIRDSIFAATAAALDAEGLDASLCAKKLKREINAKTTKIVKFKGKVSRFPESAGKKAGKPDLPTGVKIIAEGVKNEIAGKGENAVAFDDGDTVIAITEIAWDVEQRARMDLQKLLAMYPVETKRIEFDEATLNAILGALPAGIREAVVAELAATLSEKRD